MTEPHPLSPNQHQLRVQTAVPSDVEVGSYANFTNVWQDGDALILDFAVLTESAQMVEHSPGAPPTPTRQARVVSRVRIPPRHAAELLRELSAKVEAGLSPHGGVGSE